MTYISFIVLICVYSVIIGLLSKIIMAKIPAYKIRLQDTNTLMISGN